MNKISLLIFAAGLISGCQMAQKRDAAYCNSIGATGNMYAQCMMQRDDARMRRSQMLIANGNAMVQAGQSPAPAPIISTPRTTICRPYMGTVVCNSN